VADILSLEPNHPAAQCARAFHHIGKVLGELATTVQVLHDLRTRLHQGEPAASIPWDGLESVSRDLSAALHEFLDAVRGFEEALGAAHWGKPHTG
jgi:hypothetical protein